MSAEWIWVDGEILPIDGHHMTVLDQGLHYGLGVFEGIKAYGSDQGPVIFRLREHLERMQRGAAYLDIEVDPDALTDAICTLIERQGLTEAYIRPIAWLGDGRGLSLDPDAMQTRQAVAVLPHSSHLSAEQRERGIWLQPSAYRRNSRSSIPPLKLCGAYVNSVLAKRAARKSGFDGALFLDGDHIIEASAENVFMVQGDRITAVQHPDALPGITRDTLMTLTSAEARPVTLDELLDADEVFLCGTSAEVVPVTRIGDRRWKAGRLTQSLRDTYGRLVRGQERGFEHWLTRTSASAARSVA